MFQSAMATPLKRHFALAVIVALACSAAGATSASAKATPKPKPGYFPLSCQRASLDPAVRTLQKGDSWRFSKPYSFPFYGYTSRGMSTVIWGFIKNSAVRKAPYPSPNLPSCRVARFGTEDRAAHKAGKYFPMLVAIDGQRAYEFRDSFDRHIATLQWVDDSPVSYHPSRWGWYIDGKWAGHDATRAFELQATACKFVPAPDTVTGGWKWVRDSRYVMVSFAPNLGSPGKGSAPRGVKELRVRAFLDRRAIPPGLLHYADTYDMGCGASALPPRMTPTTLRGFSFTSGLGPGNAYLRGYYFGEGPTTIATLPGESRIYNTYRLDVYNPRPHYNDATYAMVNTTGVAGGGIVRGIAQSTKDTFTLYDEMRYCDPNYTLRGMQIRKGKKHYKKSLYFAPYTYSAENRKSVRWIFGKIDPEPSTLGPEGQIASQNPISQGLFGWIPIKCDR
ncbi:MAG: hypothetical protein QM648_04845 [Solirubrobacterales bacterium]